MKGFCCVEKSLHIRLGGSANTKPQMVNVLCCHFQNGCSCFETRFDFGLSSD